MFQSSCKYVPTADMLEKIAPAIIDMNCFSRVETNGGAFEQVCLLYGENPNVAVRKWTAALHKGGIQTQMLERALNAIRMYPVPADVREMMFKVKKAQGTDIARSFCGLNDHRNLKPSIEYAKKHGMISQAALSITHGEVFTVDYYVNLVDKLVEYGADEIALKDMAGVGRPVTIGKIIYEIKKRHPQIKVQYHGHSGPGFSVASMLEAARAGVDILDVAMEPLSWGMIHPDMITVQAMLKDAGFLVPDINMKAYMEARAMTQSFIDEFLGYFIDPSNRIMTSLLVGCGLPGGMMGSMMADLKGMHGAINSALTKNGKPEVSLNDLVVQLFEEVEKVWVPLGCPPLVTPFSQYVKNIALFNILLEAQGKAKFGNIDKNAWKMISGEMGKLPGKLASEIVDLAKQNNVEFYEGDPQALYPNDLEKYKQEMKDNNWDFGKDDEDLFELAMHDTQYRDFKSGKAKERFNKELEDAKIKANAPIIVERKTIITEMPNIDIDKITDKHPDAKPIQSPQKGQILWQYDVADESKAPVVGTKVKKGDIIAYVQTYYGIEAIVSNFDGEIFQIEAKQGEMVIKDQILAFVK
ncbi:pyruvate carboxylase subunit B [Bacteroidia bacterium]|nr:pyruvate carboxylase subunit B [Bacteroidia bacterium]